MYKIAITKTTVEEQLTECRWTEGGTEGVTEGSSWGYTPQIPEKREVTRTVLELIVGDLELTPVVMAILDNSDPT